jgi:hypothetical protein
MNKTAQRSRKTVEPPPPESKFRVLIAVHRPRYRSRAERAVALPGWETRSLLNREDPVGLINQKPPHLLILSSDFGRQKSLGILKAVQRFRAAGLRIIALFEEMEEAMENAALFDAALAPPWKAQDLREHAARLYEEITGRAPEPAHTVGGGLEPTATTG